MKGGTVGKHLRHTLDHFVAAMSPLDARGPGGSPVIDYDHRERNVPMEADRALALEAISSLRVRLSVLSPDAMDDAVVVRVMVNGDGVEARLRTSIGRELAFATHHAVHHQAMMKAIAQEFGIHTDDAFGKAPSTVNFESNRAARAQGNQPRS